MPRSGGVEDRTRDFTSLGRSSCWASTPLTELPPQPKTFYFPLSEQLRSEHVNNTLAAAATAAATAGGPHLQNGWECARTVSCKALVIILGHGACGRVASEKMATQLQDKMGSSPSAGIIPELPCL